MNFESTKMYAFTIDGDFYMFDLDVEGKTLRPFSKYHMDDAKVMQ
jgi:hypothetical protein